MNLELILGAIAALLGGASALTQARMTLKAKTAAGVSMLTWVIQAAGAFCWLAFGIAIGSWPQIIANICWIIAVSVLALALAKDHNRPKWHFLAVVAGIGVVAVGAALIDENLPGWLGGFFVLAVSVPQLVHTLRNPSAEGASLGSWVFFTASALAWVAYGLTLGRLNMVVTAVPQALLALSVVVALAYTRKFRTNSSSSEGVEA